MKFGPLPLAEAEGAVLAHGKETARARGHEMKMKRAYD